MKCGLRHFFVGTLRNHLQVPTLWAVTTGRMTLMTPQERQLIAELFDRLASLENKPRDPDAERAISEGVARAPHALYPLVQTVLLQDEALRAADARIRELEGE